jgi:probable rRNA maturation factor
LIDVEIVTKPGALPDRRRAPSPEEILHLCSAAAASAGIEDGHLAIEFVDERRIAELNAQHRGKNGPTDVLSFPIDGAEPPAAVDSSRPSEPTDGAEPPAAVDSSRSSEPTDRVEPPAPIDPHRAESPPGRPPRELGDVVISPANTADLREAIVHGVLHLVGFDHETDHGEMLELQRHLLARGGA